MKTKFLKIAILGCLLSNINTASAVVFKNIIDTTALDPINAASPTAKQVIHFCIKNNIDIIENGIVGAPTAVYLSENTRPVILSSEDTAYMNIFDVQYNDFYSSGVFMLNNCNGEYFGQAGITRNDGGGMTIQYDNHSNNKHTISDMQLLCDSGECRITGKAEMKSAV